MRWRTDTPTKPGWYIASTCGDINTYRWWGGNYWSESAKAGDSLERVLLVARRRCTDMVAAKIRWIERS